MVTPSSSGHICSGTVTPSHSVHIWPGTVTPSPSGHIRSPQGHLVRYGQVRSPQVCLVIYGQVRSPTFSIHRPAPQVKTIGRTLILIVRCEQWWDWEVLKYLWRPRGVGVTGDRLRHERLWRRRREGLRGKSRLEARENWVKQPKIWSIRVETSSGLKSKERVLRRLQ